MKYMVCFVEQKGRECTVKFERFSSFEDAVVCYTLQCACERHVTLVDLVNKKILRQYAFESNFNGEDGCANSICIR